VEAEVVVQLDQRLTLAEVVQEDIENQNVQQFQVVGQHLH
jgi:hypothetical protein